MKTIYKQYGITASITDKRDGTARLVVRDAFSQKVRDSIHIVENPLRINS